MSGYWPVTNVLAYLAGSWRVERSVRDLASGAQGSFSGTTVFEPLDDEELDDEESDGTGLLHHESGTFVWQDVARPAERTLRFLADDDGASRADVRFADGRPFHDLDLTSGHHVTDHPCAADLYRGEFTVHDADHWRTVWRVGGPAKDLLLTTDYTRDSERDSERNPEQHSGRNSERNSAPN
jgi:hypothetical protein